MTFLLLCILGIFSPNGLNEQYLPAFSASGPGKQKSLPRLTIPPRPPGAETGSVFMERIASLPLEEREEEIYNAIVSGNIPGFLRRPVVLKTRFADSTGEMHTLIFEVMPDYLAVGSDNDFCRIPMTPYTAQRIARAFGASLITAKLSDYVYQMAEVQLNPFFYASVGNANEQVAKFREHNAQIEKQLKESGGKYGQLIAGIKKDVILSSRIAENPDRVVIYGWHKPGGEPIQPVYGGHAGWYVDYSHGIRLINNRVLVDGDLFFMDEVLKDPVLFRLLSNEEYPVKVSFYPGNYQKH